MTEKPDVVIANQDDLFDQQVARRVKDDDIAWINHMLFLGKTWAIVGDAQNNYKNVLLAQKQYWKGTV